jgi:hypothetical protein
MCAFLIMALTGKRKAYKRLLDHHRRFYLAGLTLHIVLELGSVDFLSSK